MNIKEAKSHLRVALSQVIPSDDKIIVNHMIQAYLALGGGLNDFLVERPFVTPKNIEGSIEIPPCASRKHVLGTCDCSADPKKG